MHRLYHIVKKHAIANYYDNIDSHLKDASLNSQKLYWKLLKDCFHTKLTHDIPPILGIPWTMIRRVMHFQTLIRLNYLTIT